MTNGLLSALTLDSVIIIMTQAIKDICPSSVSSYGHFILRPCILAKSFVGVPCWRPQCTDFTSCLTVFVVTDQRLSELPKHPDQAALYTVRQAVSMLG